MYEYAVAWRGGLPDWNAIPNPAIESPAPKHDTRTGIMPLCEIIFEHYWRQPEVVYPLTRRDKNSQRKLIGLAFPQSSTSGRCMAYMEGIRRRVNKLYKEVVEGIFLACLLACKQLCSVEWLYSHLCLTWRAGGANAGAMLARPYVTEVLSLIPSSQLRNPSLYCDLPLGTLGEEGSRGW